jgi:hypothetical protein
MAAVGEFVQVAPVSQEPPVAVPVRELRRVRVVGRDDHDDRRGQLHLWRGFQGVGETAVRGHAVVPVGGADLFGAPCLQLTESGVTAGRVQLRGDLGIAPLGQRHGGGAPFGGIETLVQGPDLIWADTLSVASDRHLYAIANQLNRQANHHEGQDLRRKPSLLVRVPIAAGPVLLR